MSYIGQGLPADTFQGYTTDSFTGDGSATTFTLSKQPFSENSLIVVINNVIQKPTTNFTVSGTTLTIVGTAVASGDVIYAIHTGGVLPIGEANRVDLNGASDQLILDQDGDSTISADTDDQIDFKTGGTDRMHIASDGDVLISKTSNAYQTTGHEFLDGGRAFHTADGGKALSLVRNSSNGAIMDFYNSSGSEVGSIETAASGIGIKLGGTASANLLDDYEEGDFQVTTTYAQSGSWGLNTSNDTLHYVKVGTLVHIMGQIKVNAYSSASGIGYIDLPFAQGAQTEDADTGTGEVQILGASQNSNVFCINVYSGLARLYFDRHDATSLANAALAQFDSNLAINISISYHTA